MKNKILSVLSTALISIPLLAGCGKAPATIDAPAAAMLDAPASEEDGVARVGFEEDDLVSALKVGRYYLETENGLDSERYIEVFEGDLIQFVGIEEKSDPDDPWVYDWSSEPVKYKLSENIPFVAIDSGYSLDDDIQIGVDYLDENTLCTGICAEGIDGVKDYSTESEKETREAQGVLNEVKAHFVFSDL